MHSLFKIIEFVFLTALSNTWLIYRPTDSHNSEPAQLYIFGINVNIENWELSPICKRGQLESREIEWSSRLLKVLLDTWNPKLTVMILTVKSTYLQFDVQ